MSEEQLPEENPKKRDEQEEGLNPESTPESTPAPEPVVPPAAPVEPTPFQPHNGGFPPNNGGFPPNNGGGFTPNNGGFGMQQALPNATVVLVLGILSIVLCCCYGILGLIPAIIALVLSKKDRALYAANPTLYTESSSKNLNAGRVCAIVGLVLNILTLVYYIAIIAMFGTAMLSDPQAMQDVLRGMQ
ncbi:CCC motif membrane protein [Pedobacter namyangjuensis]|uniref:CCC motif membrane protein n=1 Tax=Pedobacter namyangjuensis TaxID=600626 RepID=UPI001966AA1B|nr:CCC motif membrane protein [Pedobacter namyangjuensis]